MIYKCRRWVRVKVTDLMEPTAVVNTTVVLQAAHEYKTASDSIAVGCFGGDVIYVDSGADGEFETGTSWSTAYRDLQDGLARARKGCGSEIWVAGGLYYPTSDADDYGATFEMVDEVELYGGFAGGESSIEERDYVKNPTVLTGLIGGGGDYGGGLRGECGGRLRCCSGRLYD